MEEKDRCNTRNKFKITSVFPKEDENSFKINIIEDVKQMMVAESLRQIRNRR